GHLCRGSCRSSRCNDAAKIKRSQRYHSPCYRRGAVQVRSDDGYLAWAVVAYLRTLLLPRHKLALEAVALRQQLAVFKRKQPWPKLDRLDRLFWIVLLPAVGGLVRSPNHRRAGDGSFLASCLIPAVLAVAVSATSAGAIQGE